MPGDLMYYNHRIRFYFKKKGKWASYKYGISPIIASEKKIIANNAL